MQGWNLSPANTNHPPLSIIIDDIWGRIHEWRDHPVVLLFCRRGEFTVIPANQDETQCSLAAPLSLLPRSICCTHCPSGLGGHPDSQLAVPFLAPHREHGYWLSNNRAQTRGFAGVLSTVHRGAHATVGGVDNRQCYAASPAIASTAPARCRYIRSFRQSTILPSGCQFGEHAQEIHGSSPRTSQNPSRGRPPLANLEFCVGPLASGSISR